MRFLWKATLVILTVGVIILGIAFFAKYRTEERMQVPVEEVAAQDYP